MNLTLVERRISTLATFAGSKSGNSLATCCARASVLSVCRSNRPMYAPRADATSKSQSVLLKFIAQIKAASLAPPCPNQQTRQEHDPRHGAHQDPARPVHLRLGQRNPILMNRLRPDGQQLGPVQQP